MASKLCKIISDVDTLLLAAKTAVGATTATISAATDDDGVTLPTGTYGFVIDDKFSASKEYFVCTLTGTALTAIKSVSRQGVQTTGFAKSHRVGAVLKLSAFPALKYLNDLLDGTTDLNSAAPLKYDGDPTFNSDRQLIDKKYSDDSVGAAQSAAESYADGVAGTAQSNAESYADGVAAAAQSAAESYADGVALAGVPDASEATKGKASIASAAQANTGTDDTTIMTPKKVKDSTAIPAGVATALGNKIETSVLDTDSALAENSDDNISSQKAVKTYVDGFVDAYPKFGYVASANTRNTNAASVAVANEAYAKCKEMSITAIPASIKGTKVIRVYATIASASGVEWAYYTLNVNGSPVGVEHGTNNNGGVQFYDDITVAQGDLVQLYCKKQAGAGNGAISAMLLSYDQNIKAFGAKILATSLPLTTTDAMTVANNS